VWGSFGWGGLDVRGLGAGPVLTHHPTAGVLDALRLTPLLKFPTSRTFRPDICWAEVVLDQVNWISTGRKVGSEPAHRLD